MIYLKSHKLAGMRVALFGVVLGVGFGCSERNKSVCCETEVDCRELGLPGGSVGNYGCDQGLVCRDTMCVIAPDAEPQMDAPGEGSGSGSGSSGRCDLAKPLAAPGIVPNINTGYDEQRFVLSANELTGYVLRNNPGDLITVTSTARASLDEDFPIDGSDPALAMVGGRVGNPWLARSDHLWFETFNGKLEVSERPSTAEPFGARTELSIGGVTNSSLRLVGTDPDALTLYFVGADHLLQAADNHFNSHSFTTPVVASSMTIGDAVITRDALTLYYTHFNDPSGDVYSTTRSSSATMFDAGTLLFAAAGIATYATNDGCEVYFATGTTTTDILVARRPK